MLRLEEDNIPLKAGITATDRQKAGIIAGKSRYTYSRTVDTISNIFISLRWNTIYMLSLSPLAIYNYTIYLYEYGGRAVQLPLACLRLLDMAEWAGLVRRAVPSAEGRH